ncbi:MAG TPA: methionine synthase, partial [Mesorhizobium sp.]
VETIIERIGPLRNKAAQENIAETAQGRRERRRTRV